MEFAFEYIQRLQSVAAEEHAGKKFPAYEAILDAVNYALKDELAPDERVIFSTRYSKDLVALRTKEGSRYCGKNVYAQSLFEGERAQGDTWCRCY